MSDQNQQEGKAHYLDDVNARSWFEKQWVVWPERADERYTMNISFHYGGVLAYRELNGKDPEMVEDFAIHVRYLDRFNNESRT